MWQEVTTTVSSSSSLAEIKIFKNSFNFADNVVCSLCKASYKDEEALKKHHAYWHEPMECALCLKIVKNRRNFDTHMNVVHSNNKRYKCSVCQKGFYHKSEMEAHQRV